MVLALDWRLSDQGYAWAAGVLARAPEDAGRPDHPRAGRRGRHPLGVRTAAVGPADRGPRPDLPHPQRALLAGRPRDAQERGGTRRPSASDELPEPVLRRRRDDPPVPLRPRPGRHRRGDRLARGSWAGPRRGSTNWSGRRSNSAATPTGSPSTSTSPSASPASLRCRPARRGPRRRSLVPGTAAYWRFDGHADGSAVSGTVRDLSGRGNDLTVVSVGGGTLGWSSDHHPDQPGHGSLEFQGFKSPLKGAYLRTVDGAPLNSATFKARLHHRGVLPSSRRLGRLAQRLVGPGQPDRHGRRRGQVRRRPGRTARHPLPLRRPGTAVGDASAEPAGHRHQLGRRRRRWRPGGTSRSSTTAGTPRCTSRAARSSATRRPRPSASPPSGCRGCSAATSTPAQIDQILHGRLGDVRIVERALPVTSFMNH